MKNKINYILCVFILISFSCDREEAVDFDENPQIAIPSFEIKNSSFFNLTDLENAFVDFSLDVASEDASGVEQIEILKQFNDSDFIDHETVTSLPTDLVITLDEALSGFGGVAKEDLEPGDFFNFIFKVTSGGKVYESGIVIRANAACPSEISLASDTWSATGTNNNGFGLALTSSATGITITPQGDGEYLISDISAGFYGSAGFNATQQGIYTDVCNIITWSEPGADRQFTFENPVSVDASNIGSWDPATQTLTVWWYDSGNGILGQSIFTKD